MHTSANTVWLAIN